MSAGEDLLRLVAPPEDAQVEIDWVAFEGRLGFRLPSDYKWLVDRYGAGSFDSLLHILQPDSPFEPLVLERSAARAAEILDQLRGSGEFIPYGTDELLPVGKTDNGDTIYLVKRPDDEPDSWVVTVNAARGVKWPQFGGGIVAFLVAVLSGAHHVEAFPGNFPSERPEFARYAPRPQRQSPS
jgi:hypothetical protein